MQSSGSKVKLTVQFSGTLGVLTLTCGVAHSLCGRLAVVLTAQAVRCRQFAQQQGRKWSTAVLVLMTTLAKRSGALLVREQ